MNTSHRRLLLGVLTSTLVLCLLLGIAEVILRLLPPPDGFADRVHRFSREMIVDDPLLSHRLRSSREVELGGIRYSTNRQGLRGPEPDRGGAGPRILVIGDSVTMGWGVPFDSAYPARLEAELELRGAPVTVINAGILAYGVLQYAPWLAELLPRYAPDLVLIGYYPNDPEPLETSLRAGSRSWSHLARRLHRTWGSLLIQTGIRPDAVTWYRALHAPGSASWEGVEAALGDVATTCARRGVPCALVLIPALIGDPYPLVDEHTRLAALADSLGLQTLDLAEVSLDGDFRRFWVAPDDPHPNAALHAAYAREIARWIMDRYDRLWGAR